MGQRRDIPEVESRNCVPVLGRSQWGSRDCSRLTDRQRRFNRPQTDFVLLLFIRTLSVKQFTFNLPVVRHIISELQLNKMWSSRDACVYTSCIKTAGLSNLKIPVLFLNWPCNLNEKMLYGEVCLFKQNQNKTTVKQWPQILNLKFR